MIRTCEKCGTEFDCVDLSTIFPNLKSNEGDHLTRCPKCFPVTEESSDDWKSNRKEIDNIHLCEKLRIRPEYYNATLDNFEAVTESQKFAKDNAELMANGKLRSLVLMGANGTGKTHLACAVLKILGGVRYTAYELSALYRECYSPLAKKTELQTIAELSNCRCLLIDELGRTKGSEAEQNFMSLLIDEIHSKGNRIIITTNKIRKSECPHYLKNRENCRMCEKPQCIERYLDNDSLSRLSDRAGKVTMQGTDRRRENVGNH